MIPKYKKNTIAYLENDVEPAPMNLLCLVGDINQDGYEDIVISGRNGKLVWYENQKNEGKWVQHLIDEVNGLEAGGTLVDITGNGYPDLVIGSDWRNDELYWWENPYPLDKPWRKRIIIKTGFSKFHDQIIGDVTGDGKISLIFWNQGAKRLYRVEIPDDPTVYPWPNVEVVANDIEGEGLAIADIDGDKINEIIGGTYWFKYTGNKDCPWKTYQYAKNYVAPRIRVEDINSDGVMEIVISEGDALIFGKNEGGKLSYFSSPKDKENLWIENKIDENLLDPHSLEIADFCGNGRLDIIVGEIGSEKEGRKPRLILYENDGRAKFTKHILAEGISFHEAKICDFTKTGKFSIVNKPLHGLEKWEVQIWHP